MHEPGIPVAEVVLEVVSSLLNGRDAVHEVVRALAPDFGHHGVRSRGVADQRGQDCFAGKGISSENLKSQRACFEYSWLFTAFTHYFTYNHNGNFFCLFKGTPMAWRTQVKGLNTHWGYSAESRQMSSVYLRQLFDAACGRPWGGRAGRDGRDGEGRDGERRGGDGREGRDGAGREGGGGAGLVGGRW